MDVTDERSIAAVSEGLELDVLVNNAGYAEVAPIELATDAAWHDQLAVNVHGMSAVTRAFAPAMMARRRGHVINVSSVVGRVTFPFLGVYGASKHAVEALTDGLRLELGGFGVRVSAIQPAFIRTGFAARAKASLARYDVASRWIASSTGATSSGVSRRTSRARSCARRGVPHHARASRRRGPRGSPCAPCPGSPSRSSTPAWRASWACAENDEMTRIVPQLARE